MYLCACVLKKEGETACTRRVTAAIHNCMASFFCYEVAQLDDCQGSHPVPPWYVDTVALMHKERKVGGLKCVSVREKREREKTDSTACRGQ